MIIIVTVLVAVAVIWWLSSKRALSRNERGYLRRRGYDIDQPPDSSPPVAGDTRLFSLLESLGDISPYSRQRAAEDLSRMCEGGRRDPRMFSSLVAALSDNDASVRSAVAIALGNLKDPRATTPLKERMEADDSIQVRAAARKALEKLGV